MYCSAFCTNQSSLWHTLAYLLHMPVWLTEHCPDSDLQHKPVWLTAQTSPAYSKLIMNYNLCQYGLQQATLTCSINQYDLTLLHSEWPKLYGVLAILCATGLKHIPIQLTPYCSDLQHTVWLTEQTSGPVCLQHTPVWLAYSTFEFWHTAKVYLACITIISAHMG